MDDILIKLFGSSSRTKVIRFFLSHPEEIFTNQEISRRCRIKSSATRREISFLKGLGLIKQKSENIDTLIKLKNGKIINKKKKIQGLGVDHSFPLINPLKNLFVNAVPFSKERILRSFKNVGKVKLIIISGIFMNDDNCGSTDLFLVGDSIRRQSLEKILKNIEAEIGKELIYGYFDTKEFLYRMGMNDRFVKSIFDYPHEKILNKLDI